MASAVQSLQMWTRKMISAGDPPAELPVPGENGREVRPETMSKVSSQKVENGGSSTSDAQLTGSSHDERRTHQNPFISRPLTRGYPLERTKQAKASEALLAHR